MDPKKKREDISNKGLLGILFAVVLIISLAKGCVENEVKPVTEMPIPVEEPEIEPEVDKGLFVEETPTEEEIVAVFNVDLTKDKLMDPDSIKVKKGTIVRWFNKDKLFFHNIVIYSADVKIPTSDDVIAQSGNIIPGEYWGYIFNKPGEYSVKDIYSGTMRGKITAEVVSEILEKGEFAGKILVE